jgi:hypothetical protein
MNTTLLFFFAAIFTTLAGIGATLIITKSVLFQPLQRFFDPAYNHWIKPHPHLNTLVNCPICTGWYVGVLFQFLIMLFLGINLNWLYLLPMFFQGCITSVFSILAYLILCKLGLKTVK